MRNPKVRFDLISFASLVILIAIAMSVTSGDPDRREQVDELATGPYLLLDRHGRYLTWTNSGTGVNPNWNRAWTTDLDDAWRYATEDSAAADAAKIGGVPRQLRDVLRANRFVAAPGGGQE